MYLWSGGFAPKMAQERAGHREQAAMPGWALQKATIGLVSLLLSCEMGTPPRCPDNFFVVL